MFDGSDDSDTEVNFKTTNEYAKNYNSWRQKELLNSLKTKYKGDLNSDEDTSSSDEDESDIELPDKVEMDFLKTLSSLKNKDPKIYDDSVKFFDDTPIDPTVKKKKKEQTMFLKDYERQMLLEHGSKGFDDEDNEDPQSRGLTYVEEQENIKKSLKSALEEVEDEDENFGGLFQTRVKSKVEVEKEEANYKQWLKGQKDKLNNAEDETSLKPLKDHWNDPNLDAGEKFLRDYILNNRFKESNDPNYVPTYDEIVHDDEKFSDDEENVDKQEEFEHKFNYRFEEPDQEFLKRYPRTVENSLRKTDDRRKTKRHELKERKALEKQEKMEDLQKLKEMKRKEIEEKIKKLKEITGNTEVTFQDQDFDEDFDPDAHDKRMQTLFNDEFYTGEEGDEKPEFPDLDEELEIERWDKLHKDQINNDTEYNDGTYAEDEDFNMDCDYDPCTSTQNELIENTKGKKKRKRKSKFAKAVSETKPVFDPNDKTYEEYLDEYYKLDCEDIVGGIPCRFKYRQVAPNNFGLTIEEILTANDKELNRWASIKKAMQYRPDHIEKYDQIAYSKKAQNEALKRKILPSLYADEGTSSTEVNESQDVGNKKIRNANKRKQNAMDATIVEPTEENFDVKPSQSNKQEDTTDENNQKPNKKGKKKRSVENPQEQPKLKKIKFNASTNSTENESNVIVEQTSKKKQSKKKSVDQNGEITVDFTETKEKADGNLTNKINNATTPVNNTNNTSKAKKKKKKAKQTADTSLINNEAPSKKKTNKAGKQGNKPQKSKKANHNAKNNNKTKNKTETTSPACKLSDARLQAFGIKPKKFKNKLKYGNNAHI